MSNRAVGRSSKALPARIEAACVWLLLAAGAAVMIFPVYWMFATAVRPKEEIFSGAAGLIPSAFVWQNFAEATQRMPFLQWAVNSSVIAVIAVIITVALNLLSGYAFAKFRFAGRNILFIGVLSALMIPIQVILVPLFLVISQLGLNILKGQYNTEWTNIMAIALLSLTPMLVIFAFFQRYFVQGIAGTGLK